jgi:hypothetical protein
MGSKDSCPKAQAPRKLRFWTFCTANGEIIDVGIGMAKFQNAYYPGCMPKVGCPGCNGDTMEYVEQDK